MINPSLWYQCMYPTGILCLSSYLDGHGHPNTIVDSASCAKRIPYAAREAVILDRIRELDPKVICFSCTHREFDEVVRLNAAIRSLDRGILTIVGGSQPTYRTSDFLDNGFDFVCAGEGEKTLLGFVEAIAEGSRGWGSIDGLIWRQDGAVVANPPRPLMPAEELDFDLISAYGAIDPRYFGFGVEIVRGLPMAGALLLTTRGCPYDCSFCGCNAIFGRKLRHRPLASIEREVAWLVRERRVEGLWILDDTFTINKEHALAVARMLHLHGVVWGCQSRVDSLTPDFTAEMRAQGCVQMDFGVESGSQRILDEVIGKRTRIDQVIRAFDLAKRNRIRTLANFMIGFPTETAEDLEATKRLADRINADIYVFSIATPLPGTRLYAMVGEEIRPQDYASLNWNGSPLTEKLNKSALPNVVRERRSLKNRYLMRSVLKSMVSEGFIPLFVMRNHRLKRMRAAAEFLYRTVFSS